MFEIVAAHGINYAATASVGYIQDFIDKVQKAAETEGTSYIHIVAPCPTGWGCPADEMINTARDIVDCGLWYLAEYENGEFKLTKNPKEFISVENYLNGQSRFKQLSPEDISYIIEQRDKKWKHIRQNWI